MDMRLKDKFGSICFVCINSVFLLSLCLINCFTDQEAVGNNEPSKRQRRWNSESLKLPEQQSSTPTSTPRDNTFQSSLKRSFMRSDSAVSEDTPKERVGEL